MTHFYAPFLLLAQAGETTTTTGESGGGTQLLMPTSSELIAGFIAFVVIFLVVWRVALPGLNRTLKARQDAITGQLNAAETSKLEAESLLTDYKQQLARARDDANRIVEEARQAADALRRETATRAETEAAEVVRKAREEAAGERQKAAGAIRDEVAALSLAVAEKAMAGAVDAKAHQKLVEQYIAELGTLHP